MPTWDRLGRYGAPSEPSTVGWSIAKALICLVIGIGIATTLLGAQHQAGFWAIDDHELLEFYNGRVPGSDEPVKLSGAGNTATILDLPRELMGTEVGQPGVSLRYRPVYYAVRLLEVDLWGDNPADYYVARTVMFGLLLAAMLWVGWLAIGPLGAVLLTVYALNFPMWGDVWCRLGPSEQYAAVGLALFLIGFGLQIRSFVRNDGASWTGSAVVLGLGLIIAAGSKENFVFMACPVFLMTAYGVFGRRIAGWAIGFVLISLAFATFIALAIARAAAHAGADIYGNAVSMTTRAQAPILFLRQFARGNKFDVFTPFDDNSVLAVAIVALVLLIGVAWALWRGLGPMARSSVVRRLRVIGGINVLAVIWLVWEIIFYNGNWPWGNHYDFPGILIELVFAGSLAAIASTLLGPGLRRTGLAVLGFAGLIAWQASSVGFAFPLEQSTAQNVHRTRQFTDDLQRIADEGAAHPDWPIFVEASIAWDFEPVATLADWLGWKDVHNKVYLRFHDPKPGTVVSPFDEKLLGVLHQISERGTHGYQPIATLDDAAEMEGHCFSVSYSGPVDASCVALPLRFMGG